MKVHDVLPDSGFKLLDASPDQPHTPEQIQKAMKELHARVHHQAELYGGKWDKSRKKFDKKTHEFYPAFIAHK